MKVKIKRDTIVRFAGGSVIDVADEEGKRLISLGNAEEVKAEKPAEEKPKAKKKKTKKEQ